MHTPAHFCVAASSGVDANGLFLLEQSRSSEECLVYTTSRLPLRLLYHSCPHLFAHAISMQTS